MAGQNQQEFLAGGPAFTLPPEITALETGHIRAAREQRQDEPGDPARDALGLAFSGGGIRSATFNLGVLRALNEIHLDSGRTIESQVDYLSTVSGGGYAGAWYVTGRRRARTPGQIAAALAHLRQYSRYLAPQSGLFSADTWTMISIWMRNAVLLQALLLSLLAALLLTPRLFMQLYSWSHELTRPPIQDIPGWTAGVLLAVVNLLLCWRFTRMEEDAVGLHGWTALRGQRAVQAPLLCLLACAFFFSSQLSSDFGITGAWRGVVIAEVGAGSAAVAWSAIARFRHIWRAAPESLLVGAACGALFLALMEQLKNIFYYWSQTLPRDAYEWRAFTWGGPVLLLAFAVVVVWQIGLIGRIMLESRREWWSRLGAYLVIYCVAVMLIAAVAVYSPLWFFSAQAWLATAVSGGGLATVIAGLLAARSPATGGAGAALTSKHVLALAAPYVFIVLLLAALSTGLHALLYRITRDGWPAGAAAVNSYWADLTATTAGPQWDFSNAWAPWLLFAAAVAMALLLAWRVDLNRFSMNAFYRNRLVRCYLGAWRQAEGVRHAQAFTGFDFADDYALAALHSNAREPYYGPLPIINTALNVAGHGDASLEERRAHSFTMTPFYCGSKQTGYLATRLFSRSGGVNIGSAIAASGAAVSPNCGFHSSAPVAFLLTFFNVRLGWWYPNPSRFLEHPVPDRAIWGLRYVAAELFASADDRDSFVYLSDGGHFENLALYELIRRRCRFIIACDAEQDGGFSFGGLGSAIRKARIDLDTDIRIDVRRLRERDSQSYSRAHCAVGRIWYSRPPGYAASHPPDGWLLYLKSSLTGDEDTDVLQYAADHKAFPHESTGNQFFSESQFESYRRLGYHSMLAAVAGVTAASLEDWFKALEERWLP